MFAPAMLEAVARIESEMTWAGHLLVTVALMATHLDARLRIGDGFGCVGGTGAGRGAAMDKIPDGSGHLYKHVMVLGTFLAMASIYGFAVTVKAHNEKIEEAVLKTLLADDAPAAHRQWWQRTLEIEQKNMEVITWVVVIAFSLGIAMAIAGGWFWYRLVQKFEDENRSLENQKLRAHVHSNDKGAREA